MWNKRDSKDHQPEIQFPARRPPGCNEPQVKEKGKTWLARKLSIGKAAEKDHVPNQSEEDRVEIDEEDGRKNDSTRVPAYSSRNNLSGCPIASS